MKQYKFTIQSNEGKRKMFTTAKSLVPALKLLSNAEDCLKGTIIDIKIKPIPMIKVKFKKWNCVAIFSRYVNNDRISIRLIEEETNEPIATASVNLTEIEGITDNEIAIKDYGQNEGMVNALRNAGIIGHPIQLVENDYVKIGIYELLKKE